jgi:NADH-quinone oxidoreductase subunit E
MAEQKREAKMQASIEIDSKQVDGIIDKWKRDPAFVIEMMQDLQDAYRHLPRQVLARISRATGTDMGRLYHIATFYKAFSLDPRGELSIQVCTGTACHVRGATRVMDALSRELDVAPGGTTDDLRFTLEGVRCVGCCSLAPVVTVGKDLHGGLISSKVQRLLKRYRKDGSKKETSDA